MLLNRLEKYSNANANPANVANVHPQNTPTLATLATLQLASPVKTVISATDEIVSNWWLLHFTDRESEQVAIWPPSSHAEVLALNPEAIAAEPISSPIDDMADVGGDDQ